mmetsp:Transcript_30462/g.61120  ORF Transcript_30462/g.61120 Transcript_30462/m.61120 type:complete len:96 (-) Transcript_30462:959-1246(-)
MSALLYYPPTVHHHNQVTVLYCAQSVGNDNTCFLFILAYFFEVIMISNSVCESKLEVGSSQSSIGDFFRIALASDTRCFSPPDIFNPRSPTTVLY